ncbi:hypothetical protein IHE44_0014634 [Lamprotornis superbus]|uniref:G-protein coupled receptors family 1 profile domain-containing protein n=1 Tax=Lamprotornis superbus TaxID=245042 RepID=A0A835U0Q3_9PASS|nr:hypothetical protein IHE44_0014634 [Lamprotornis superbus]
MLYVCPFVTLSSGLLIELSENGTEEIGSGDYGDYEEPCFQHENADFNRIFLPTIYSIIFLTGIIGNGLVIIVMGYQKKQRSMTDKYRLHLSVADLLFVITLPFWSVDAAISWYFGNALCKAVHVIYTVNLYSSVLILAFISLDRYLAIVHATNSQRPRKLLAEKVVYLSHSKGHQKRKALKTTVILILAFFACWLPYYIGISIDTFILLGVIRHRCSLETIVHKWISITEALAFFHCCLNPILYAFLGAKFKTSAQNALTSARPQKFLNW